MGILWNVKSRVKLSKLKDRLEKNPSPAAVGELARLHIHSGDMDAAYSVLEEHLGAYPDSELLKGIWNYVRKSKVSKKIRALEETLKYDPSPETYQALIKVYRDQKDLESAMESSRSLIKRFPNCAVGYRMIGLIRLERFAEDFSAKDGKAAEGALIQAKELDPQDHTARFLLARLYYCCALTRRARALVDAILAEAPDHRKAATLKQLLDRLDDQDEDPDLRFSEIEERREFHYDWRTGRALSSEEGTAHGAGERSCADPIHYLEDSLQTEGTASATFISREGSRWGAGSSSPDAGWEPFSQYVERIAEAARKTSLRMDIGSFKKCIIEGDQGGAVIRELSGGTVGFLLNDKQRIPKAYPVLRDIMEEMALDGGKNDEGASEGA